MSKHERSIDLALSGEYPKLARWYSTQPHAYVAQLNGVDCSPTFNCIEQVTDWITARYGSVWSAPHTLQRPQVAKAPHTVETLRVRGTLLGLADAADAVRPGISFRVIRRGAELDL